MAAAGGDTVVPTNWKGLFMTAVAVAIVAGLTYVGLGMFMGQAEGEGAAKPETSLQDLYSINARRDIPAMDTVRALPRTALAPNQSLPPPEIVDTDTTAAPDSDDANSDDLDQAEDRADATSSDASEEIIEETGEESPEDFGESTAQADTETDADSSPASAMAQGAMEEPQPATASTSGNEPAIDTRYRATTAALRAWWNSDTTAPDALGIRFVGPLDSSVAPQGMAVLFDQAVDAKTFTSFIQMQSPAGRMITPQWRNGQNPRLVYAQSLPPGRYTLTLEAGMPARNGFVLPQELSGPVFVN